MNLFVTFEAKRVEELKAQAATPGKELHRLDAMDGYAEWLNHPITRELLGRVEYRRGYYDYEAGKLAPCPSCKKDGDGVDKEHRGWLAGIVEALNSVARAITADKIPPCDHG